MSYPIRGAAALALVLPLLLAGCGGGGGPAGTPIFRAADNPGSSGSNTSGSSSSGSSAPIDPAGPSASFAQQCAANNTLAAGSLRTSTLDAEKKWLRAYYDEAYLWRDEVSRVDPTLPVYTVADTYAAMDAYFEALKTTQTTDTGQKRDRFSFTYPTDQWKALTENAVEAGYGIEWKLTSPLPPRQIQIAYVEAGSPADRAGLKRGDLLVSVDSVSADVGDAFGVDALNAALFPAAANAQHSFVFSRPGGTTLSPRLTSASLTKTPVPISRVVTTPSGQRAGYLLFNDHIAPAEGQLIAAMRDFQAQGLRELVLDLRYNGGGYLYIASELATMIAGASRTGSQTFETLKFNARRSSENEATPFYNTSCILVGNRCTQEQPLPALNLTRLYVLAQSGTCSASESVINGLRGIGVDVVLIGGKTCGKPYGFTAKDNCGVSYFPIEFVGVNAQGFGDYADGLEPKADASGGNTRFVKGCTVADDTGHALGDTSEGMLSAALRHIDTGTCPAVTAKAQGSARGDGVAMSLKRDPARSNRFLVAH